MAAYTKTEWINREVEKPRTYTQTTNADGTITLTPAEGTVFAEGTPIVAENMNKIEDELEILDTHTRNQGNPHGVTASQVGAYSKVESDDKYSSSGVMVFYKYNVDYSTGWQVMSWPYFKDMVGDYGFANGTAVTVPDDGLYSISVAVSLANTTLTGGYVLLDLEAGIRRLRLGGTHYTSDGNFSVNGSAVVKLAAGDLVSTWINSNELITAVGHTTEFRTYMTVHKI